MNRVIHTVRPLVLLPNLSIKSIRRPRLFSGKWAHPGPLRLFILTTVLFLLEITLVTKLFF